MLGPSGTSHLIWDIIQTAAARRTTSSALSLTAVPSEGRQHSLAPRRSRRALWSRDEEGSDRRPAAALFFLRKSSQKVEPPPVSVITAHSRVLLLPTRLLTPPPPLPTAAWALKRLVGLSHSAELDMVNVALTGPKPLRGGAGGLNRTGIWWQYASGERLFAFITTL